MTVVWTETAIEHLDAIYAYIARDSVQYALRTVDLLTRRSEQIAEHPLSGRTVQEFDVAQVREVIEGSYRMIYHIKPDAIDILAVIHAAQNTLSE
ncbi:type II toxin-antitoxin system RelE/ParE family toxin [Pontiellaceae bacterium B1224]|nr:type II toxin-antitoxin system RelE/ParE family toxin [Pontiellaceae bacterium B1224]